MLNKEQIHKKKYLYSDIFRYSPSSIQILTYMDWVLQSKYILKVPRNQLAHQTWAKKSIKCLSQHFCTCSLTLIWRSRALPLCTSIYWDNRSYTTPKYVERTAARNLLMLHLPPSGTENALHANEVKIIIKKKNVYTANVFCSTRYSSFFITI